MPIMAGPIMAGAGAVEHRHSRSAPPAGQACSAGQIEITDRNTIRRS